MTAYTIQDWEPDRDPFQTLVEQSNVDGQSLEAVASSIIGNNLEKLALKRERDRRAMIIKLSREIGGHHRPIPLWLGKWINRCCAG